MDLVAFTPRVPDPGETVIGREFMTYPGGKGANQAVAAARLGARVRMVGRVGADEFGPALLNSMSAHGIDVSRVYKDPERASGVAVIWLDAQRQNRIVIVSGANAACDGAQVEAVRAAMDGADVLMVQHEVPMDVTVAAVKVAVDSGVVVVWDPAPADDIPAEALGLIDVLVPNQTEAEALAGIAVTDVSSAREAASVLLAHGAGAVVIKLAELGAYYATANESGHVVAPTVEVVDTVAAGDAFGGGLAVALGEGAPLLDAVRNGVMAGTAAVTKVGAQDAMPGPSAVEAMLRAL